MIGGTRGSGGGTCAVGEDAEPGLTDEGGVDEEGRLVGRETEEDLLQDLVRQRRRHVACWLGLDDIENARREEIPMMNAYFILFFS